MQTLLSPQSDDDLMGRLRANDGEAFAELLSRHRTIVAVDLPGHGQAPDLELDVVGTAHALLDTLGIQVERFGDSSGELNLA